MEIKQRGACASLWVIRCGSPLVPRILCQSGGDPPLDQGIAMSSKEPAWHLISGGRYRGLPFEVGHLPPALLEYEGAGQDVMGRFPREEDRVDVSQSALHAGVAD